MLYHPFESDAQVSIYHERCNKYFETFPDSTVLRRGIVDVGGGIDSVLASLKQLTGVTPELEEVWESNKQKLRNRELPIPFFMRGDFLQNTRDIYTTWVLSKFSKDEELEFRIIHAPQAEKNKFFELIDNSNVILFEETSLLILSDLNLLDDFLKLLPKFYILESVFKKINLTTHEPISINNQISGAILKSIQNNLEKLQLIEGDDKGFKYDCNLNGGHILLLTDDLYVIWLVEQHNQTVSFGNIFNILEFLYAKNILNEEKFNEKTVDFFEIGVVDINCRYDFLAKSIDYYLSGEGVSDYSETNFSRIFDKLLSEKNSFMDKLNLFLNIFSYVDISRLSSDVYISLIRKLLEDHPIFDPQKILDTWFFYFLLQREIIKQVDTSVSKTHDDLWLIYERVMNALNDTKYSRDFLLRHIYNVIKFYDKKTRVMAINNLKASFSPCTDEYKYLESLL